MVIMMASGMISDVIIHLDIFVKSLLHKEKSRAKSGHHGNHHYHQHYQQHHHQSILKHDILIINNGLP